MYQIKVFFSLNTQAVKDNQVVMKSSLDQFHQENEWVSRDLSKVFYNESTDSVKNYSTK